MNKKGWGLVTELIVILIAILLLVYAVYGLNQLGLIRNLNEALGTNIKPELIISGKKITYEAVETNLINASTEYISDKYNNDFAGEEVIVRVSSLIKNDYINTIRDKDNKECTGYVKVSKKDIRNVYTPYLKCKNYTTVGYESEYDW